MNRRQKQIKFLFICGVLFILLAIILFGAYILEINNKNYSDLFRLSQPIHKNVKTDENGDLVGLDSFLNQTDNVNKKNKQGEKDWNLEIPEIGVEAPIITEVDGENEKEYLDALKNGVAQLKGSYLPGIKGNTFIFGHSSYYWWDDGKYKDVFEKLNDLLVDQQIIIKSNYNKYVYQVYDKKIVSADDVYITKKLSEDDTLVLMTCYPVGTTNLRLVIFAKKVN